MGDDDDYSVDHRDAMALKAMAKLLEMNTKINSDASDYYETLPTLEETLRKEIPALKDAWDQYQVILKFAKAEHYARQETEI